MDVCSCVCHLLCAGPTWVYPILFLTFSYIQNDIKYFVFHSLWDLHCCLNRLSCTLVKQCSPLTFNQNSLAELAIGWRMLWADHRICLPQYDMLLAQQKPCWEQVYERVSEPQKVSHCPRDNSVYSAWQWINLFCTIISDVCCVFDCFWRCFITCGGRNVWVIWPHCWKSPHNHISLCPITELETTIV